VDMHTLLAENPIDMKKLSEYLDGLPNEQRIAEVATMNGKEQEKLFEAADGFMALDLDFYAPTSGGAFNQVIHHGRNNIPLFTRFQKRFCLPDRETDPEQRWGYNHQTMALFTGPGYFVAKQHNDMEVVVDYYDVPPAKPEAWPKILPNSARLSRFVYYHTRDYLRRVSKNVSIGRASRNDEWMPNWFVLCREDK
jgi:hypothetical protein